MGVNPLALGSAQAEPSTIRNAAKSDGKVANSEVINVWSIESAFFLKG